MLRARGWHGETKFSETMLSETNQLRRSSSLHVPVEGDGGDDVAGAHPAADEPHGQPVHAVDELRAGEPATA